jgi:hypothetical protein
MASLAARLHHAASCPWFCRPARVGWLPLARVLLLLGLFLLPVQMRAGAADAHPHALLQLLLDARDGSIDHHGGVHPPTSPAAPDDAARRDAPELAKSIAAGGVALLAAMVFSLDFPAPRTAQTEFRPGLWRGRAPELEPPPPRIAAA